MIEDITRRRQSVSAFVSFNLLGVSVPSFVGPRPEVVVNRDFQTRLVLRLVVGIFGALLYFIFNVSDRILKYK